MPKSTEYCMQKGDEAMEQAVEKMICSNCRVEITDEREYLDNKGVCDDCYSIPIRKKLKLKL